MDARSSRDKWAEWVLARSHANDAEQKRRSLEFLGPIRDGVLEKARINPGDVVLDVGAGDGLIAFGALPLVGESGRVIFCEVSEDLLEHCRVAAEELGVADRAEFVRAAAEDLSPIPAASVNAVTTRSVLIYVQRKGEAFREYDPSESRVAIWTQHTVFGGAGAEVRWYEIAGDTGAVLDSGKATSSSLYAFNGAISPDRAVPGATGAQFGGSMALTFNTSSGTTYSAIQYLAKPVGGIQSVFTKVVQSAGKDQDFSCSSGVCRWGDYAGASPDPVAGATGGTVWMANQYNVASTTSNNVDWRTWIFNVVS